MAITKLSPKNVFLGSPIAVVTAVIWIAVTFLVSGCDGFFFGDKYKRKGEDDPGTITGSRTGLTIVVPEGTDVFKGRYVAVFGEIVKTDEDGEEQIIHISSMTSRGNQVIIVRHEDKITLPIRDYTYMPEDGAWEVPPPFSGDGVTDIRVYVFDEPPKDGKTSGDPAVFENVRFTEGNAQIDWTKRVQEGRNLTITGIAQQFQDTYIGIRCRIGAKEFRAMAKDFTQRFQLAKSTISLPLRDCTGLSGTVTVTPPPLTDADDGITDLMVYVFNSDDEDADIDRLIIFQDVRFADGSATIPWSDGNDKISGLTVNKWNGQVRVNAKIYEIVDNRFVNYQGADGNLKDAGYQDEDGNLTGVTRSGTIADNRVSVTLPGTISASKLCSLDELLPGAVADPSDSDAQGVWVQEFVDGKEDSFMLRELYPPATYFFLYMNKAVTISGTAELTVPTVVDLDLKKGWNMVKSVGSGGSRQWTSVLADDLDKACKSEEVAGAKWMYVKKSTN